MVGVEMGKASRSIAASASLVSLEFLEGAFELGCIGNDVGRPNILNRPHVHLDSSLFTHPDFKTLLVNASII